MMSQVLKYMEEDESPLTLRGLLNKHYSSFVIGKSGSTHQYIEKTYKVKLYLDNESDELGRLCSISGSLVNVSRAWREVLSIVYPKNCSCNVGVFVVITVINTYIHYRKKNSKV